jgi:hypothetical protein
LGDRIDHGWQRFEFDADASSEIERFGTCRCDTGGDGLSYIPDFIGRQHRPHRRTGTSRLRHHMNWPDVPEVGGREDTGARFGRYGDAAKQRMRVRGADERHFLRTAQFDVGDELAAPTQMAVIFLAQQRRADATVLAGIPVRHCRLLELFSLCLDNLSIDEARNTSGNSHSSKATKLFDPLCDPSLPGFVRRCAPCSD